MPLSKPRVLVLADTRTWAWARKGAAYRRWLPDWDITLAYSSEYVPDPRPFDLVHLFEVSQLGVLAGIPRPLRRFKVVAGLTAHVWRTWGEARMRAWAGECDAMHGNSKLMVSELTPFHPRVFETPNGVEPETFRRTEPHPPVPVFAHVGKPNPRKGGPLIQEAARRAGVELRMLQRTSKLAISEAEMVTFYQGVSVQVCASNMDGTPNPMLESASCRNLLISTPIGNMPEFISNGVNGFLTAPLPGREQGRAPVNEDMPAVEQLIGELEHFFRHLAGSPAEVSRMGDAARETVLNHWTWEKQVAHVAWMWQSVLESTP
jgi:glycosyltransferase involved in cell wall biosynthesis